MILLALFASVCLGVYLSFVLWSSWHFRAIKPSIHPNRELGVSIIIPARNEESGLETCLSHALAQSFEHDNWEVILVDDHSEDATREIAESMQNHRLRILQAQYTSELKYKKAALATGIKAARFSIVLQTDADCTMGPHWARNMVAHFEDHTHMVSGPVAIEAQKGILQHLQSLEYLGLVALGAAGIQGKKPHMCNGANLAFRKASFQAIGGYQGIAGVASGDDELLMQKFDQAFPNGIRFAKIPDAIVRTMAQPDWQRFKQQRLRWVSKSRSYINKKTNLLQLLSFLGFWSFPLWALLIPWNRFSLLILMALLGLKSIVDLMIMIPAANFFHKLHLLRYFFLLELLYIPYVLWIGIAGNLRKSYTWKNRKLR